MRVLVTGAAGFVGANIMHGLDEAGVTAIGLVSGHPGSIEPGVRTASSEFYRCDLRDIDSLKELVALTRPDYIVHAAAITPSPELESADPVRIHQVNELSTLALLEAAAQSDVQRFLLLSSAAVYPNDPTSSLPLTEDSPLDESGGMYALTKIASERLCRWAHRTYGLDARAIRLGPVYGFFERPTHSRNRMSAVHQALEMVARQEVIRCNHREAVQDWIFGTDAADAILRVLLQSDLSSSVFNLAGPGVSMATLLETVREVTDAPEIHWVDDAQANLLISRSPRRAPLDISRIQNETGYRPRFTLRQGIDVLYRRDGN